MNINIRKIPHKNQRYPTCGDWTFDEKGDLTILVSEEMGDDSCLLVALHELVEVILCRKRGISQESVDEFDMNFEANRKPGDLSEPGDQPLAPYFNEHKSALIHEYMMAQDMGVPWREHEDRVNGLPEVTEKKNAQKEEGITKGSFQDSCQPPITIT